MAFYTNAASPLVVDNNRVIIPAQYSTRANLPSGANAYLAFVTDQSEFVHYSANTAAAGPDAGVVWYKFLLRPMDYKNEVILEQGTVGGGYVGSSVWNTISRVINATDVLTEMQQTLTFTTNYGCWFSSYLYAYYGQGGGTAQNKQDWATFTVSTMTSRPTSSFSPNSTQPGPKMQNTRGLVVIGTTGNVLDFTNDTWTTNYGGTVSHSFGTGSFGQSYGYMYTYASGANVQKFNWGTNTWSATSSGNAYGIGTTYGKSLNTKNNYWYYAGDVNGGSGFSRYSNTSDAWTNLGSEAYASQSEQCSVMGQDHGYFVCGYNASAQNNVSQKVHYPSDTILLSPSTNGKRALSSGNPAWGPMP